MAENKSPAWEAYVGLLTGGLGILVLELIKKIRSKK
jgi:hypothetical protein